jgi:hypothetical protein
MSNRIEEATGGGATYPVASGAWTLGAKKKHVIGFRMPNGGAVTLIEYANGHDYDADYEQDYTVCAPGMYYHFPAKIVAATFSAAVDLIFE